MPVTINGSSGITSPAIDLTTTPLAVADGGTGLTTGENMFRNRIINGDMRIDQRNAGASVTFTNSVGYSIDRYRAVAIGTSLGFSVQRSTTAPVGFVNSLLATVTSAKTPASSDQARINQYIEGFNVADLGWGTANAQAVTLSFWVRSSVTGTYCVAILNADSATRSYVATYTINSANTWEQKSITIAGDTSGTWTTSNSIGMGVSFSLNCGSSFNASSSSTWYSAEYQQTSAQANWIGTSGATFYITGVQLEKGSTATSFDYRPYGTELALCQRYYERIDNVFAVCSNAGFSNSYASYLKFTVTKRAVPTVTVYSSINLGGTSGSVTWYPGAVVAAADTEGTTTDTHMFRRTGTSTYNLATYSAAVVSEL